MAKTPEHDPDRFGPRQSDIGRDTASSALMDTMAGRLQREVRARSEQIGKPVDISGPDFHDADRRVAWDKTMRPLFDHYERAHQGPAHRALSAMEGHSVTRGSNDLDSVPTLDTTRAKVPVPAPDRNHER